MAHIGRDLRIALAQAIELAEVERITDATVRKMQHLFDHASDVEATPEMARVIARAVRFVRRTHEALEAGERKVATPRVEGPAKDWPR